MALFKIQTFITLIYRPKLLFLQMIFSVDQTYKMLLKIKKASFFILLFLILCLSSCSTHKKSTKRSEYYKKERQEVDILSSKLKGDQKKIIVEAEKWIGTPYKYAAQEKGKGTDCSGYVMMVYKEAIGCLLPRSSRDQAEFCRKIKENDVRPGDLVFFNGKTDQISHVGIMVDKTNFLHASSSKGVILSSLQSSYYAKHFKMFGRLPCM